jgi:hypothetical protein
MQLASVRKLGLGEFTAVHFLDQAQVSRRRVHRTDPKNPFLDRKAIPRARIGGKVGGEISRLQDFTQYNL